MYKRQAQSDSGLADEQLVQRVAVEEGEELREDGFTVVRRLTTMYHIRTEFMSPKFRGDEPRKVEKLLGTEVEEQITELAPGVHLPYGDDAEVQTMWDECEDCLPDGTWIKKKTTRTTVCPPPSITELPATTSRLSDEGTRLQRVDLDEEEKNGLVDSGYRDETSHDLIEELAQSSSHVQQLESSLLDLERFEQTDLTTKEPAVDMTEEITDDLAHREGMNSAWF